MTLILKSRFAVVAASISAALALSACQPAPTDERHYSATNWGAWARSSGRPACGSMSGGDVAVDAAPVTAMHKDYTESMTTMHDEMMIGMAYNDPDTAFAQGMLGHHISAVDMAQIELKYGTDEAMRKLAQEMIDAQQPNIELMQSWITEHKG